MVEFTKRNSSVISDSVSAAQLMVHRSGLLEVSKLVARNTSQFVELFIALDILS